MPDGTYTLIMRLSEPDLTGVARGSKFSYLRIMLDRCDTRHLAFDPCPETISRRLHTEDRRGSNMLRNSLVTVVCVGALVLGASSCDSGHTSSAQASNGSTTVTVGLITSLTG